MRTTSRLTQRENITISRELAQGAGMATKTPPVVLRQPVTKEPFEDIVDFTLPVLWVIDEIDPRNFKAAKRLFAAQAFTSFSNLSSATTVFSGS